MGSGAVVNRGAGLEAAIDLGGGLEALSRAIPVVEASLALPTLNNIFIDSAAVQVAGSKKTIYVVVTTALSWVTSGQPTFQPFAGRTPFSAVAGAATGATIAAGVVTLGSAQNLGAAAQTSLPAGIYRLSPATVAELQWPDQFVGVELKFPSALTGGAALAYLESGT